MALVRPQFDYSDGIVLTQSTFTTNRTYAGQPGIYLCRNPSGIDIKVNDNVQGQWTFICDVKGPVPFRFEIRPTDNTDTILFPFPTNIMKQGDGLELKDAQKGDRITIHPLGGKEIGIYEKVGNWTRFPKP